MSRLRLLTTALSPLSWVFGGFSGNYIVEEASKVCPVNPVWIDGITRVNIFVTTPEGELKFPNAGATVIRSKQDEMLELLRNAPDLDVLVVSGSLSPEMDQLSTTSSLTFVMSVALSWS